MKEETKVTPEKFVAALVVFLTASLLHGYVAQKGWAWFIVPLGLPPLSFVHAFGIGTFTRFMTTTSLSSDKRSFGETMSLAVVYALIVLFVMWLTSRFMY